MKRKGQTESYSFLIGLFLTFLLLTGVGCAVYTIYSERANTEDTLERLAEVIKNSKDGEEGDVTVIVDDEHYIVGFDKDQDSILFRCAKQLKGFPNEYSTYISQPCVSDDTGACTATSEEITNGISSLPIPKPDTKQCKEKACICLCPQELTKDVEKDEFKESCEVGFRCIGFDEVEILAGGGVCLKELFIGEVGDLASFRYRKSGKMFSLHQDSPATLNAYRLAEDPVMDNQYSNMGVKLEKFLKDKGKLFLYFLPLNWPEIITQDQTTFDKQAADIARTHSSEAIKILKNAFETINFQEYIRSDSISHNCEIKNEDLNNKQPDEIYRTFVDCYTKAFPNDDKFPSNYNNLINVPLGLIESEKIDTNKEIMSRNMITYSQDKYNSAYWLSRMLGFCDESSYDIWKETNAALRSQDRQCLNPYPLCCYDNPKWNNNQKDYIQHLDEVNLDWNCYPTFKDAGKIAFETKEEYRKYIQTHKVCLGHVCEIEGNDNCRGVMGPKFGEKEKQMNLGDYKKDLNPLNYKFQDYDFAKKL